MPQTWTSVFDLFRIGIGPSSSHTVGPMIAAGRFVALLPRTGVRALGVELFGSLALTGKGHGTDTAVILGLLGERPDRVDPDQVPALVRGVAERKSIELPGGRAAFDPATDLLFTRTMLPRHPNAVRFTAVTDQGTIERTYYSVGGGFVVAEGEEDAPVQADLPPAPFPFETGDELLALARGAGLTIAELQRANERT